MVGEWFGKKLAREFREGIGEKEEERTSKTMSARLKPCFSNTEEDTYCNILMEQ